MINESNKNNLMRNLPSIDKLLKLKVVIESIDSNGHDQTVTLLRKTIEMIRGNILTSKITQLEDISLDSISNIFSNEIKFNENKELQRTINATGVILHTNLGRAPLSKKVTEAALNTIENYCNLEYDIESGKRGSRHDYLKDLLCRLTGAEDAVVVNNNAAAVMLILSTFAKGKEVIVSRGELVEIGGSFRVPSVMEQSGSRLVEVGTTNKTHPRDYEDAITENTALLMKIHTSNFKILGFTQNVDVKQLTSIGKKYNIPIVEDIGSGVLVDLRRFGLPYEPTVQDSISQGADLVSFSGDKLLGGPQAGIIVGKKELIQKIKKNQLLRALRIDKVMISLLYHTLKIYDKDDDLLESIPILSMMSKPLIEIESKANFLYNILSQDINWSNVADINVQKTKAQVGGGSLPNEYIDSYGVFIKPKNISVVNLEENLRKGQHHIISRIQNDMLILDVRTLFEDDLKIVSDEIKQILLYEV